MIRVILASHVGVALGQKSLEIQASTVKQALSLLSQRFGAPFDELLKSCRVLVCGTSIVYLDGLSTPLREGDELIVLPPMAGG